MIKIGKGKQKFTAGEEVAFAFGRFLTIFVGSLVLGAVLAFVASFILKRQGTIVDETSEE